MTATTQRSAGHDRLASAVSDVLGPLPVTIALCAAGVKHSATWVAGIGWGVLAIVFAAILPYLATWRIRHPSDGSLPTSKIRVTYMLIAAMTAAVGLVLLHLLGGPTEVIHVTIAVLVTLVATALVNAKWRWSNHASAVSAGTDLLVDELGRVALVGLISVVLVAWARIQLGRHGLTELIGGAVVGAAISMSVMLIF